VLPDEYPLDCAREGALTYAWPFEDRDVWVPKRSITLAMVRRAIPPARSPQPARVSRA
jgi:hypothetical protein